MGKLADFFSPEAGQRRTRRVNDPGRQIGEAAQYYLGPTGIPDRLGAVVALPSQIGDAVTAPLNQIGSAASGAYRDAIPANARACSQRFWRAGTSP